MRSFIALLIFCCHFAFADNITYQSLRAFTESYKYIRNNYLEKVPDKKLFEASGFGVLEQSVKNAQITQEQADELKNEFQNSFSNDYSKNITVLVQLMEKVKELNYKLNDYTLLNYAIDGLTSSLDEYSTYLRGDNFKELKENITGQFAGIGIYFTQKDDKFIILSILHNSPAERENIKVGDTIKAINEQNLDKLTVQEVNNLIKGNNGSTLNLTLERNGHTFYTHLIRENIKTPTVSGQIIDNNLAYIRIIQFQNYTKQDFILKFEDLLQQNPNLQGLIVDLRNNPGGLVKSALSIASLFIDKGVLLEVRNRNTKNVFEADNAILLHNRITLPVVTLINKNSASAAEILAAILKDNKRGILIGEKSFGKGSVQNIFPTVNNSALKLTTGKYYTKNKNPIHKVGIMPDLWVNNAAIRANISDDEAINKALEYFQQFNY